MTLTDPPPAASGELVVRPRDHQVLADVSAWTTADYRLTDRTRAKLRAAVPANTLRAYERWWAAAAAWCTAQGRVALPMTAETLTEWVRTLTDTVSERTGRPLSVASLDQAVAAVRAVHAEAGFDGMPGTRHTRRLVKDHGRRLADAGRVERKSAVVTADQALTIAERCDAATAAGARDRLLVAVSFSAWTRRSELAALNLTDVRVSTDPARPGVFVRFRKSKTDQGGRGAEVFLPARGDALCPLAALRAWRTVLAERGITDGRLLRGVDRWGNIRDSLAAGTVNDISKRLTAAAGLAVDEQGREFTAHGWRASGYGAARDAGASEDSANRHGRWSPASRAAKGYHRDRGELTDHPMAKVVAQQTRQTQEAHPGRGPADAPDRPFPVA